MSSFKAARKVLNQNFTSLIYYEMRINLETFEKELKFQNLLYNRPDKSNLFYGKDWTRIHRRDSYSGEKKAKVHWKLNLLIIELTSILKTLN